MHILRSKNVLNMLFILVLLMVVAACSSDSSNKDDTVSSEESMENEQEDTPVQGGEAVFAYEGDVSNFDPIKGGSGFDHVYLWPIFDTLTKFNADLELEPGLAESWEITDDETIILHLQKGVTFHDNTAFDAEAVKFNLERVNSEDSNIPDLENIDQVKVIDDLTVQIDLVQPDSSILLALSDRGGMMVSPTAVKENGEDFSQEPIGAGPFKIVNYIPNGEVEYEKFENYWEDGKPYLDKMIVKVMADENTRINALKSGEVDYADRISPANIASLEGDQNLKLKSRTTFEFDMFYLNTSISPLENKEFRQAIQYGIDREAIINAISHGEGEVANQPFPSNYWAASDNVEIEYNPEKSKKLLEKSGVQNPKITMNHYSSAKHQRLGEAIKAQLEEIGIEVDLQSMESTAAISSYFNEDKAASLLASWTGRPDPQMTINNLFKEDSFYNVGNYSTDELKEAISKASKTYEDEERTEYFEQITEIALLDEAMLIPLFFEPATSAMNLNLKGFEQNLYGKPIFSSTWIKK